MSKTRKKPSSDAAKQHRLNMIILAVALIVTAVMVAIGLSYTYNSSQPLKFPDYLNQCIPQTGKPVYVASLVIEIFIGPGQNITIPANIGVEGGGACIRPIHTRGTLGVVDIDDFQDRNYTLGDFFLVWGHTYGATFASFGPRVLFNVSGNVTMLVNNERNYSYSNYVFPRHANVTSNPVGIVILYNR